MIIPYDGKEISTQFIYFSAKWCSPCKTILPVIEASQTVVTKIDVDEFPDKAVEYGIVGLPTIVDIRDSERIAGGQTASIVFNFLKRNPECTE